MAGSPACKRRQSGDAQPDDVELRRFQSLRSYQLDEPGDDRAGLDRSAVHERASLVAAAGRDHVDHGFPCRICDRRAPQHHGEPDRHQRHERGVHGQNAESGKVDDREQQDHGRRAEPPDEPTGEKDRHQESSRGCDGGEESEESGQGVGVRKLFGRRPGEWQVESEEQDRKQHGGQGHPLHHRGSPHEAESLLHPLEQLRLWLTRPPSYPLRGSRPADEGPAERERRDQSSCPHEQQVLGPDPVRKRPCQRTANDGAEDDAGPEEREQPLRLSCVDDDAEQPPREEGLHHLRHPGRKPQDRVDPDGVRRHHCALGEQHGSHDDRQREEEASAGHAPQESHEGE